MTVAFGNRVDTFSGAGLVLERIFLHANEGNICRNWQEHGGLGKETGHTFTSPLGIASAKRLANWTISPSSTSGPGSARKYRSGSEKGLKSLARQEIAGFFERRKGTHWQNLLRADERECKVVLTVGCTPHCTIPNTVGLARIFVRTIDGKVTFLTRRPWYSIPGLALAAPGLRNNSPASARPWDVGAGTCMILKFIGLRATGGKETQEQSLPSGEWRDNGNMYRNRYVRNNRNNLKWEGFGVAQPRRKPQDRSETHSSGNRVVIRQSVAWYGIAAEPAVTVCVRKCLRLRLKHHRQYKTPVKPPEPPQDLAQGNYCFAINSVLPIILASQPSVLAATVALREAHIATFIMIIIERCDTSPLLLLVTVIGIGKTPVSPILLAWDSIAALQRKKATSNGSRTMALLDSAFTITNSSTDIVDLWNGEGTTRFEVLEPGQLSNQYSEPGSYLVRRHFPLGPSPPKPLDLVYLKVVVASGEPDKTFTITRSSNNFVVQTVLSSRWLE
ncbi:hypothetical protein BC827DRAFT_1157933 [Russula dissimulans]|nr:hypothetical protein BC827DRAFT_1157933 [Russula dissimulans]